MTIHQHEKWQLRDHEGKPGVRYCAACGEEVELTPLATLTAARDLLRAQREAATPGPWWVAKDDLHYIDTEDGWMIRVNSSGDIPLIVSAVSLLGDVEGILTDAIASIENAIKHNVIDSDDSEVWEPQAFRLARAILAAGKARS